MKRLENIKSKGATEFILDLRYNSGGAVSSATALASSLVKNRTTSTLFNVVQYNELVHSELEKEYGTNFNKTYFEENILDKDDNVVVAIPNLGIDRIYILVSNWTASASELIINGLKPHMDVVLIGQTTVGKTLVLLVYMKNDPKNKWGMQPIMAKYFNSNHQSDFTAGFEPDHKVNEFDPDQLRLVDLET